MTQGMRNKYNNLILLKLKKEKVVLLSSVVYSQKINYLRAYA